MTADEATELGRRIINTMRPTPALAEWTDVLNDLHHGPAMVAFRQLRVECEHGLSIARFIRQYRDLTATSRREPDPTPTCALCDGDGWVDAEPWIEIVNGQPQPYTQLQPCACETGQRMRPVHASILEHNRRTP